MRGCCAAPSLRHAHACLKHKKGLKMLAQPFLQLAVKFKLHRFSQKIFMTIYALVIDIVGCRPGLYGQNSENAFLIIVPLFFVRFANLVGMFF